MADEILYISGNGFPESSTDSRGAFSLEHAAALKSRGMNVRAIDTQAGGFSSDVLDGIAIDRLPRLRSLLKKFDFGAIVNYLRFFRSLRRTDAQQYIIFSFFYLKYIPLMLLLRHSNSTMLIIPHGGDVMPGGYIRRRLKRWMFDRADVVTPVSDFTAVLLSCLINRKDRDNTKIVTIYNGVNWGKLSLPPKGTDLKAKHSIGPDVFVILSICNLIERKGIDILIRAIGDLEGDKIVRHIIIGRGPQREALEKLAKATRKPERFLFLDRVDSADLVGYYAISDLFAIISKTSWDNAQTEGFGITYAEAMALGVPVIGGDGSGTTSPIKHGFNGLLVDPHSPQVSGQVCKSIERFISDDAFRNRTSENARWFAREFFDWDINAQRTIAALEAASYR